MSIDLNNPAGNCAICMDANDGTSILMHNPISIDSDGEHVSHKRCLKTWLVAQQQLQQAYHNPQPQPTCPTCRAPLNVEALNHLIEDVSLLPLAPQPDPNEDALFLPDEDALFLPDEDVPLNLDEDVPVLPVAGVSLNLVAGAPLNLGEVTPLLPVAGAPNPVRSYGTFD